MILLRSGQVWLGLTRPGTETISLLSTKRFIHQTSCCSIRTKPNHVAPLFKLPGMLKGLPPDQDDRFFSVYKNPHSNYLVVAQFGQVINTAAIATLLSTFFHAASGHATNLPFQAQPWEILVITCISLAQAVGLTWLLRRSPAMIQFDDDRERFRVVHYNAFLPYGPLRVFEFEAGEATNPRPLLQRLMGSAGDASESSVFLFDVKGNTVMVDKSAFVAQLYAHLMLEKNLDGYEDEEDK